MEPDLNHLKSLRVTGFYSFTDQTTLYRIALVSLKILPMQTTSGFYGTALSSICTLSTGKTNWNGTRKRMANKVSTHQGAVEPQNPRGNNGCMSKGRHFNNIIDFMFNRNTGSAIFQNMTWFERTCSHSQRR